LSKLPTVNLTERERGIEGREERRREGDFFILTSIPQFPDIIKVRRLCLAVQATVAPIHGHLECREAKKSKA